MMFNNRRHFWESAALNIKNVSKIILTGLPAWNESFARD